MDAIFKNYEAFYNMVLSTTIMSNAQSSEFETDAKKIIEFIGKSYNLDESFIENCKTIILDQLISLGLTTDQQAVYSNRQFGDKFSDTDALFDIKGDVLSKLQGLNSTNNYEINPSWFDYSHYKTYQANVRFAKISATSASGNLIATRQVGILSALGIGCPVDADEAIMRLSQCAFWGDIPAMYYLAHAYSLAGNNAKSKLFYEVAALSKKYLKSGYTVLPKQAKDRFSEEAVLYYAYISSIRQDVVYAYNKFDIDFSFIEAITSDSLDYYQRMNFINNYERKEWKNVTNSYEQSARKLGFK